MTTQELRQKLIFLLQEYKSTYTGDQMREIKNIKITWDRLSSTKPKRVSSMKITTIL